MIEQQSLGPCAGGIGGRTPALTAAEFAALRFGMVLYAKAALQGAVLGMFNALQSLHAEGILREAPSLVASFAQRQELVRKALFNELEIRY